VSPDGRHVLFVTDYVGRTRGTLRAARTSDGAVVLSTSFPYARLNDGRPRWLPDGGAFAFVAQDGAGVSGVFVQPFTPGADTTAQRRPLVGFDPDAPAESFGISPTAADWRCRRSTHAASCSWRGAVRHPLTPDEAGILQRSSARRELTCPRTAPQGRTASRRREAASS
jgi:hypothetical protein